jgi:hypothetical protein
MAAEINAAELQAKARKHGEEVFRTVDFHVEACGLDEEKVDLIYTAIHESVVDSFMAGYRARASEESA